ncbi:MAG: hypothetical protein LIP09_10910 [Bacteroidales bacterium]|nr:hypothetical protein [Bacteroidales bacterium]
MATKKTNLNQYGICTNKGKCHLADSRERQEIPLNKPFVCSNPECGKPLMKVAPPKPKGKGKVLWLIICIVVLAGAITWALIALLGHNGETVEQEPLNPGYQNTDSLTMVQPGPESGTADVSEETDSLTLVAEPEEPAEEAVEEPAPATTSTTTTAPAKPSISVPFGTYSGPANGLDGEIRVTRAYSLDLRNAAHETLELQPGDVITKTKFKNGELVGGYWKRGSEARSFHR